MLLGVPVMTMTGGAGGWYGTKGGVREGDLEGAGGMKGISPGAEGGL